MLRNVLFVLVVSLIGACLSACAPSGLYARIETAQTGRIWVVKGGDLYRCADAAPEGGPPQPLCVRTPISN